MWKANLPHFRSVWYNKSIFLFRLLLPVFDTNCIFFSMASLLLFFSLSLLGKQSFIRSLLAVFCFSFSKCNQKCHIFFLPSPRERLTLPSSDDVSSNFIRHYLLWLCLVSKLFLDFEFWQDATILNYWFILRIRGHGPTNKVHFISGMLNGI